MNIKSTDLNEKDVKAIENFKDFLKIPSISQLGPVDGSYEDCVNFIKKITEEEGFEVDIYREINPKKPILIAKHNFSEKNNLTLMINCHYDVVPVEKEKWKYDPFVPTIENGKIYGRGSQDMKCVGIQVLEAIKRLKLDKNFKFTRPVCLTFTPDEEIGSEEGMKAFVETDYFKNLNVGYYIDEGMASIIPNVYEAYYNERVPWWVELEFNGRAGHGSYPKKKSPMKNANNFLQEIQKKNSETNKLVEDEKTVPIGNRTTFVVTNIQTNKLSNDSIEAINVLPSKIKITVDIRVSPKDDPKEIENEIESWKTKYNAKIQFKQKGQIIKKSEKDFLISKFKVAMERLKIQCIFSVFAGATDARFLRAKSVESVNFSPMVNIPLLAHDHDEYITVKNFIKGIEIYMEILRELL